MLLSILLLAASFGSAPDASAARPAICIKATLNERGRFTDVRIVEDSGSGTINRDAQNLVKNMDLSRIFPGPIEPQTGYLSVTSDKTGAVTMGFTGKLLSACPSKSPVVNPATPAGT